jgi:hypothetical protein
MHITRPKNLPPVRMEIVARSAEADGGESAKADGGQKEVTQFHVRPPMSKIKLSLQPSEAVVVQAAATIYAAHIVASKVVPGKEQEWIDRSIRDAIKIARKTDEAVQSDTEMG